MAPASAVAHSSVLQKQSKKGLENEPGRGRMSLDSWVCQPSARPVRTATGTSPQFSFSASSCTGQNNAFRCKTTLTLDLSFNDVDEACTRESGCETPKSKKHKIPVVDVDRCPPAPKKARARGRLSVVCAVERERSNLLQKLGFSPGYLF